MYEKAIDDMQDFEDKVQKGDQPNEKKEYAKKLGDKVSKYRFEDEYDV